MKALENREFLAFCKLLFFRSLKKQKIQAIYFEIYGLYFKISALYFSQQAMCFFAWRISRKIHPEKNGL